jgi:acetoacetyl-CoA synthetase
LAEGTVLWQPSTLRITRSRLSGYARWLAEHRGLTFAEYPDLWRWSVEHLDEFWGSVWDYFDVRPERGTSGRVLERGNGAEGARWFPDARLNYVDQALHHPSGSLAIVACAEGSGPEELTYGKLSNLVGAASEGLRRLGVGRGDRVAAVLPNGAPAVIGFLASTSLGAIWSSCAPEFGAPSMVDRFRQIEPKVLIAASGYRYRGRCYDLAAKIARLESELPSLTATVIVPAASNARGEPGPFKMTEGRPAAERPERAPAESRTPVVKSPDDVSAGSGSIRRVGWAELLSEPAPLVPEKVEFSHPLWILFSSGTTGLPKPIVHGHGGIVLEHLKALALHCDLGPGDRFFWFTTTGWMMWNFLIGGLLVGTTIVLYDGDPLWPDESGLWRLAQNLGITYFGTSAPFIEACRHSGFSPRQLENLRVRSVGSTGAPLSPEGFAWASSEICDNVLVGSVSGGTDICSAFLICCPWLEVRAGELQCRALGARVEAYDESGRSVVGKVGELVLTDPMPSMPISLWGDDGTRLHDSYFARYPGVWQHGDWVKITPGGSAVVYGRSDATLNRGGVRMGTAEFYRVVEELPEVSDALVVDTSELGHEGELLLFVVPSPSTSTGGCLSDEARVHIRSSLRERLSPRHVPDRIIAVRAIPRTISGKKLEVPVRRILLGAPKEKVAAPDALADPAALDELLGAITVSVGTDS